MEGTVGIHALGQGLDVRLTGLVDGLPVGVVADLLDGLFQCFVEGTRACGTRVEERSLLMADVPTMQFAGLNRVR